jgi:hypothetical protein
MGAGIAVFDAPMYDVDAASTLPIDTLVFGAGNPGNLVRIDGTIAEPDAPDVYFAGDSLRKDNGRWIDNYSSTPNQCP